MHAHLNRRQFVQVLGAGATLAAFWNSGAPCHAQGTRGFDQVVEVYTTGDERNRQKDLWAFEIQMKPMRLLTVEITDPETGEPSEQQIWYLAYRAINRPIGTQLEVSETAPVNALDSIRQPPKFMPEFTLMVYDDPVEQISSQDQIHIDEILPEAVAVINRVEARRSSDPLFRDSVSVITDVAAPVASGDPAEDWIYGVATGVESTRIQTFSKSFCRILERLQHRRGSGRRRSVYAEGHRSGVHAAGRPVRSESEGIQVPRSG